MNVRLPFSCNPTFNEPSLAGCCTGDRAIKHAWITIMLTLNGITHRHPEILSGVPVFVGTRVPVRSLFDYLEGGDTLEEFLHQFPSVKREQAIAILDAAYESVIADAHPA